MILIIDEFVTIGNTGNVSFRNTGITVMQSHNPEARSTEITVIAVIIALLVLLQPMLGWWGANDNPWYSPYLVWLGIILLAYCLQRWLRKYAI